jgi:hypothetical protein
MKYKSMTGTSFEALPAWLVYDGIDTVKTSTTSLTNNSMVGEHKLNFIVSEYGNESESSFVWTITENMPPSIPDLTS